MCYLNKCSKSRNMNNFGITDNCFCKILILSLKIYQCEEGVGGRGKAAFDAYALQMQGSVHGRRLELLGSV